MNYYRKERVKKLIRVVAIVLVMGLVVSTSLAYASIEPFVAYKDSVINRISSYAKVDAPIVKVESVRWLPFYYIDRGWEWADRSAIVFNLVVENALSGETYKAELYVREKFREQRVIRFSEQNINAGVVKPVRFTVFDSDIKYGDDGSIDFSIFDLIIRKAPATWRDLPEGEI